MVRTRSQRTIAHVLPRELLSRCIEFLPLEDWRYRPVHSFLDTVRNDWQDRGVADSVASEIESFRIWGPALWDTREGANDEIDVPRDYVPAATA